MVERNRDLMQEPGMSPEKPSHDSVVQHQDASAMRKRRLALLIVVLVMFIDLLGFGIVLPLLPRYGKEFLEPGLILLFVARFGAGIAGATVSTAQAVIADTTTPERRSRGMALIGAAFGVGFTFGPVIGFGALYLFPGYRGGPGFVAAGFSLIALVLGVVLMPETLRPGVFAGRRGWFNMSGLRTALQTPTVGFLILIFFFSTLAFASFEPTLALWTSDVLHYSDDKNFLVFAYVGLVLMIGQGGIYQVLARRGVSELTFILLGTFLMAAGLGGVGLLAWTRPEAMFLPLCFSTISLAVLGFAFVTPSVQALISRRSDPGKQGEILGVNQSANALSRILGPWAGTFLYSLTSDHTLPYIFAVVLYGIVLLIVPRVQRV